MSDKLLDLQDYVTDYKVLWQIIHFNKTTKNLTIDLVEEKSTGKIFLCSYYHKNLLLRAKFMRVKNREILKWCR
jgi:hypothetical protein